jgi:hypothetical protein
MKDSFCGNELTMLIQIIGNIAGNAEVEQHFLASQVSM